MAIRSIKDPDKQLYLAVHWVKGTNTTRLVFHKDCKEEATSLAPRLAAYCFAKVGKATMEWFGEEAIQVVDSSTWKLGRGLVEKTRTMDLINDWGRGLSNNLSHWEKEDDTQGNGMEEDESTGGKSVGNFDLRMGEQGHKAYDNNSIMTFGNHEDGLTLPSKDNTKQWAEITKALVGNPRFVNAITPYCKPPWHKQEQQGTAKTQGTVADNTNQVMEDAMVSGEN